jgi:long-chain acyl-CoA synthetase
MPFEPRYRTLIDIYDSSLKAHGPRELFGTKKDGRWTWLTYAEFGSLVERFRGGLASLGLERGERVAMVSNNRVEWAVVAYASYGLGVALVPMYEAQNPKDWEYIVRDCEAKTLIVANESALSKARGLLDTVSTLQKIVLIDGATTNGDARITTYASVLASGRTAPLIEPASDEVATLLYTSGTTGNPKGVVLTHANIASNVSAAAHLFPIRPSDRSLSILPWAHAFGQTSELHTFVSKGASIAISEGVDKILDNLADVRPTLLACVPTIFNRLYIAVQAQLARAPAPVRMLASRALAVTAKQRQGLSTSLAERALLLLADKMVFAKVRARLGGRLRFAISGGAALSREVAEFIDSIGITVYEGYGLTETSPVAAANGPGARKIGSVGRAFPGVRLQIDGATDEIIVYGPGVMKGYFKRPDETASVFTADGGFRTGDMGYVDDQGYLFITGRIKEQYKLENGKYVVPSPLEEQLKLSPFVVNAMVYGDNKPYNVALIVPNIDAVRKWAAANHVVLPQGVDELVNDERVRELYSKEIAAHTSGFKGFERIMDFALVPGDFSVERDMLTPKLSLKRRKIIEAYAPVIEQMYARAHGERRAPTKPLSA